MKLSTRHDTLVHCCLLWSIVSAAVPRPAYFSAYATVDESTFYIQGGSNVSNPSILYDQFYSLDLTQSWNITNPPWSALAVGLVPARLKTVFHSISLSSNRKTLTFWDMYSLSPYSANYHLDTNAWEVLPPLSLQPSGFKIAKAATDPTTDRVYIPGGAGNNSMLAYDPITKKSTALADSPAVNGESTVWNGYTFVWSELRKSFLLFGGLLTPASSSFYEYKPTAASPWNALKANGTLPPVLAGSCMVPAHNGTKMILFGGAYNSSVNIDTLYILDVASLTWSQGGKHQPRSGAACSVSGDYFLVWGGTSVDNTGIPPLVTETPAVYNINTNQWTNMFIAKIKQTPPPTTVMTKPKATHPLGSKDTGVDSPATEGETTSNNSNSANIGGAVGAGVVVILIVIGVVFRRRRSQCQQQKKEMQEHSTSQARPDQKNRQDLIEAMYSRHILPPPEPATTPQAALQSTHPANYSPNTAHSGSPQQGYCQGLQQDSMDSYSRLTPSHPQRIKSSVSSRSASTLVATPSMTSSPRYPSSPQSYFFDSSPLSQRNTRNPQDHSALTYQEYYTLDSTPNNSQWIQNKINALQAEADRLQAMLHP